MVDVSIIFVSYNTAEMTKKAIDLVKQSKHQLNLEIFVVDNASRDGSAEMVAQIFPDVTLITNAINVGFGRANNQVLPQYRGRYVLLLNTDAFVEADTIQKTVAFMDSHPTTGILGVKLLGRDGVLQPSCRYFPTPFNIFLNRTGLFKLFPSTQLVDDMAWDHQSVRDCDWVPGCYYLIRKEAIDQVGLFDQRYFLYYEEVDHCYATKQAGWQVTYYPDAPVVHIGGESAKIDHSISSVSRQVSALQIESELLYFRKNLGLLSVCLHVLLTIIAEAILAVKQLLKTPGQLRQVLNFKGLGLFLKLTYLSRAGSRVLR
ncbi:glycosyltransferase family 2 protein [Methylotenera sp. N17]|uniref:glycosyltransferase family 2 protein n=1 Tax=Methylotenera sp. N17 TaxID=1502761 RepID=UPI002285694D|nr:glycosyltransferase family 2 protein [Methylotenera sp. N17]